MREFGGTCRIGNNRNKCDMCNRFVQKKNRLVAKLLAELHPQDVALLHLKAELKLYPKVMEEFLDSHPQARPDAEVLNAEG